VLKPEKAIPARTAIEIEFINLVFIIFFLQLVF
jgi:hypothetical protein